MSGRPDNPQGFCVISGNRANSVARCSRRMRAPVPGPHHRTPYGYKENTLRYVATFVTLPPMTREEIAKAASKMATPYDILVLVNRIKQDELGGKAYPFTMDQLRYFLDPARNKAHYRVFTIPKKSGGERTVYAPQRMLKSLLTYLNRILQALYEAPACVTGFVPGKSVKDNAAQHVGKNYVFNTDLEDFFPSIPQARVWAALQCPPCRFNRAVASTIAGLCCTEVELGGETRNALPQGSPCSPVLTNLVCHNLDWKLGGLARRFRLTYSRYADDITFSGQQNVFREGGEFLTEFRRIVAEQHFQVNEKKTRLQRRGERQEVTGLVVSDRVNVAREYVRDLDNLLYIWERYGEADAFLKFFERHAARTMQIWLPTDMPRVIRGRLAYLKMVKGGDSPVWQRLQVRFDRLLQQAAEQVARRRRPTCSSPARSRCRPGITEHTEGPY